MVLWGKGTAWRAGDLWRNDAEPMLSCSFSCMACAGWWIDGQADSACHSCVLSFMSVIVRRVVCFFARLLERFLMKVVFVVWDFLGWTRIYPLPASHSLLFGISPTSWPPFPGTPYSAHLRACLYCAVCYVVLVRYNHAATRLCIRKRAKHVPLIYLLELFIVASSQPQTSRMAVYVCVRVIDIRPM